MSANAAIIARLGLDAGEFKKDLQQADRALSSASSSMAASHKRQAAAADSVWEREKRVENQMVSLSGKLANAATANEAVTASFTALAESINLPLSGAIAAGAGIAIGDALNKAAADAEKVRDNLGEAIGAANATDAAAGIVKIHQGLQGISGSLAEIRKDKGIFGFLVEGLDDMGAATAADTGAGKRNQLIADALAARDRLFNELISAESEVASIQEMILAGDKEGAALAKVRLEYEQKISDAKATATKAGAAPVDLALIEGQLNRQRLAAERQVIQDAADARGKALEENMAKEADGFRKREALEEQSAARGRDTEFNMATLAEKFREQENRKEVERADFEKKLDAEVIAEREKDEKLADAAKRQRIAAEYVLKKQFDDAAAADEAEKVAGKLKDIDDPQGKGARRAAEGKAGRHLRRAIDEVELDARGGKAKADAERDNRPLSERVKQRGLGRENLDPREFRGRELGEEIKKGLDAKPDGAAGGGKVTATMATKDLEKIISAIQGIAKAK